MHCDQIKFRINDVIVLKYALHPRPKHNILINIIELDAPLLFNCAKKKIINTTQYLPTYKIETLNLNMSYERTNS